MDGLVYFCPTFCSNRESAVQARARYNTPPTVPPVHSIDAGNPVASVTIQENTALKPNCRIVIRIGSFPLPHIATDAISAANSTALNKAKASPFVTVPPSVRDAAKIPAVHKIAA